MRDRASNIGNLIARTACRALFVSSLATGAQASDRDYLTEEDVFSDIPIANSASRFPQALNKAPASVIIIDREMIQAAGVMELPDLFRLLPGFQVYSPAAAHPVFNYHTLPDGFPGRLEIKIDGRSIYEPMTNTAFWITQGLDVEDIDYIEVVRGSNVPADGSNAINGSVNIVTRSPLQTQGVTLRAEGGSNETANASAGYSHTGTDFSYRLSGRYRSNDGFPDFDGETVDDDSESWSVNANLIWAPTLKDEIRVQLGYSDSEFTFDEGNSNVMPEDLFEWDVQYNYQHVEWQHQLNDRHGLKLLVSRSRNDLDAVASVMPLSELIGFPPDLIFPGIEDFDVVLGVDDGYSERYDLELSHTGNLGDGLKFDWGAAARYDRAKSQLHFSTDSTETENFYRLFGNTEYAAADWLTLNAGASLDYSDTIDYHSSWRASANFHLNSNNTIRLTLNRATRAPTILAANYYRTIHNGDVVYDLDLIADPDIQEEERDSVELGYYGFFQDGNLTLDLKLFYEDNDNLFDIQVDRDYQGPLSVDNEVTYMTNSLESEDHGFEAYLKWRPDERWLVTSQYTWLSIDATHYRRINPDASSDRSDAVPEHTGSIMVDHDFGNGIHGGATWYYQSSVDWKNAPPTDSYDRLDLNLRKEFQWNDITGRVEFLAQNAFGDDYSDYRYFHQFESRYYLRVVTEF